jgi:hypothetical protein
LQLVEDAVVQTTDRAYQVAGRVRVLHLRESFELYPRTRSPSAESLESVHPPSRFGGWVRGPLRRVSACLGLSGGYQRPGLRISPFVSVSIAIGRRNGRDLGDAGITAHLLMSGRSASVQIRKATASSTSGGSG